MVVDVNTDSECDSCLQTQKNIAKQMNTKSEKQNVKEHNFYKKNTKRIEQTVLSGFLCVCMLDEVLQAVTCQCRCQPKVREQVRK